MNKEFFQNGLHGKGAHVDTSTIFDGLDWRLAGEKPENCPHSVWELLSHMVYWQNFMLAHIRGETPKSPEHAAETWPESPAPSSEETWDNTILKFKEGLEKAEQEAEGELTEKGPASRGWTRAEWLMGITLHNSYHTGQVVFARRLIGAWPPPSGGQTW